MSQVYVCDICGKVNPRSIRRIISENPDVRADRPLNTEKHYAFNLFHEEMCDECLYEIEKCISHKIYEMKGNKL